MPKVEIVDVKVDLIDKSELQKAIEICVEQRNRRVFAYVNVHAVNIARHDNRFREFLNSSSVAYCDGEGVRMGAQILGWDIPPRIVLTYWIWELCEFCEEKGYSMFFVGGASKTIELAVNRMQSRFKRLKIAGWHHGFFEKSGAEAESVIEKIADASPDILFVGFGMPLQEHWIGSNFSKLKAFAVLPAGSMIEYVAGTKSFAPSWMANNGMEWLYRLFQEPRRLWRRYVIGNPLFLGRIILQLLKQRAKS